MSSGNPRLSRSRRGLPVVVGLVAISASACAPRLQPGGPVTSPTGITYEIGTRPVGTRFSQTATLYLRQENLERALELALEGIESDPLNAIHYYLAGTAHARLGQHSEADAMFVEAERIYPAYQLDVEPERERAWAEAFNAGIEAFDADDMDGAIDAWNRSVTIYSLRPDAHRNLAVLLAAEGRYDEALEVYDQALSGLESRPATRVLSDAELADRAELSLSIEENLAQLYLFTGRFVEAEPLLRQQLEREPGNHDLQSDLAQALTGQGRDPEATEIYLALLTTATLDAPELFNIGVSLFRSGDYAEAGDAFERLTKAQPNSRDAWFNYVNSLFAAEEWDLLAAAGDRLVELDPLSENAGLISARAYLEAGDEDAARRGLERTEGVPVHVEGLRLRPAGIETIVEGRIVGNEAEPGTPMRLRFTFYGEQGTLGSEMLAVGAPTAGESEEFEISFARRAISYRYELLP